MVTSPLIDRSEKTSFYTIGKKKDAKAAFRVPCNLDSGARQDDEGVRQA
jgi:hypothetical protein